MSTKIPIGQILRELASADPDRPCITVGSRTLTRRELDQSSDRLAQGYRTLGVGPGDTVTIALGNSTEMFECCFAIWKLGAVPQPVSGSLPVAERTVIVELARPVLVVGVPDGDPSVPAGTRSVPAGWMPPPVGDSSPIEVQVSPIWRIATSGGSTGRPKLIVSGFDGRAPRNRGHRAYGMRGDDVQLVPGPLYHSAPFIFAMWGLELGQHVVVLERFEARAALAAMQRHRVTFVNLVPTMMHRMARLIDEEPELAGSLADLRLVWHMAAPCPPWLKQRWIDLVGPAKLMELYSSTEGVAATVISGTEWLERRGSVGRVRQGEIRIVDDDGNVLPPGEIGLVQSRSTGAKASYRYIGAEAERDDEGWEVLGDMGHLDSEGYLYLADRRLDMIISGGANVYPAEVEAAIDAHPQVETSVVVGLPDPDLGQRVHAVVSTSSELDVADLLARLNQQLSRYKVPRSIEVVDGALRDEAGKVRRADVRAAALARLGATP